ncbi:type II toxin-antitoxin system RelE/ParE family toxin [Nitrospirillum bahiense]|uniref:type II toxin-antitoxin system RelE/ParE family toxin n=1 Tax=Nitrospirillum amazonense TaxID=28077 RepID=UPI0011A1D833|nr:type II toxin-antitoxin system RelE/ParE family toxin [Nitrospirillum amazonense]
MKDIRDVRWISSSLKEILKFPEEVRQKIGYAIYQAQLGTKHSDAKPMKGFGDSQVLEIVDDHNGNTYRCVYTVRFPGSIYVLHAFQKKSKGGIATPLVNIDLIRMRLKAAEEDCS